MAVLGIDPGITGGIAYLSETYLTAIVMPSFKKDRGSDLDVKSIVKFIKMVNKQEKIKLAALEKVWAYPGQGVVSSFTFGKVYGEIRGVIRTLGIDLIEPTPQQWKAVILPNTNKDKAAAIDFVRSFFPSMSLLATPRSKTPHIGLADAICLAEYARKFFATESNNE